MEKKVIHEYTFDALAQTIKSNEFNRLRDIALITNVTDGVVIYDALDATLTGTLSGNVLTLAYDTTLMSDTDELQILMRVGTDIDRIGFAKAISNGVDTDMFTLRQTGSGMTVNQTGGNLVITTGTTARSETIIRGLNSYSGGIRARIQSLLSQRIANQQFFFELVDVVGDSLAYTINSATSITVTLPASFGLSSQNIGQSMTLQQFSGTGTFLSGRYPIASVSGNDATFTVSGFAAGTGTLSAVGWNFYRLEYSGTTVTNALWDTGRNGYASGNTTATINTTASPGHMAIMTANDGQASLLDQLVASTAAIQTTNRAQRVVMVPDDAQVYLQIRILNGSTAPASTTTWTIGQVSVGHFEAESVIVQDLRPVGVSTAIPVEITRSVTIASGTTAVTMATNTPVGNVAHDAVDSGAPLKMGAKAYTTNPVAVASADRTDLIADKQGKLISVGSIRDLKGSQKTTITSSTSETTIITAVASVFLDVYSLMLTNTSATACNVTIKDATAGTTRFVIAVPAGQTVGFTLPESGAHKQAVVNNNWTATCSASVASIEITALYVQNL
jgi:hypothetical protein